MKSNKFSNLALPKAMIKNLESLGFQTLTPIQQESLPPILEKKDIIAQAKTGSGKTAAFGIGLLLNLDTNTKKPSSLILCPTRELADQVAGEVRRLARHMENVKVLTLCGGTPIWPQLRSLDHGAHIVVGTPGRIQDHLKRNSLKLQSLKTLVLDEADRMLDMGFEEEINYIADLAPASRQTLLFSATYPTQIKEISQHLQMNPIKVEAETVHKPNKIRQVFVEVDDSKKNKTTKTDALIYVLGHYKIPSAVIFCQTKLQCDQLADTLYDSGFFVEALHGDMEQRQRDEVLTLFAGGSISLLIATDVAARGIDIKNLPAVINYDLPRDPETYVHRIGRTGRSDKEGLAISLFNQKDSRKITDIENYTKKPIEKNQGHKLQGYHQPPMPPKSTIRIEAGKKNKMRPGDILGALTKDGSIGASAVGNINIFPYHSYVAVNRSLIKKAQNTLNSKPIKGRRFKAKIIR